MIIVGGLTRLTNSGLSITEWELFTGILPPFNQEGWNQYFSLYKKIPQYELINKDMSINEFKTIFYWEYFHRILGRLIVLFFLIPLLYFYFKKKINKNYLLKCYLILGLIILQGFIGWYMVESGLVNKVTVSHYRLSLHLSIAFVIMSVIFWNLLNISKNTYKDFFFKKKSNYYFYFLILLIFLQIIMGAFVSGLDAGKIYQTWPLMNDGYFPNDVIILKVKDLFNFNDHSLVQFYHRNIAYIISIYIILSGIIIYKKNIRKLFKSFYIVSIILILQIFLGIFTLLSGLNIFLASAHQITSLLLVLSVINLHYNSIK
jgi:cytochrome c oxidase assembly protein subunit 15